MRLRVSVRNKHGPIGEACPTIVLRECQPPREPLHGWGISKRIQQLTDDELSVGQGSLYPALHRLEQQGWIVATWQETELGRRAKFYALSREGRAQLNRELQTWKRLSSAVCLLLKRA